MVLRDPVHRAFSNWRFSVANGLEDLEFEECLTDTAEQRPFAGSSTSPFHYRRRSCYADLIAPWAESFGQRLIVLQYERMVAHDGPNYLEERLQVLGLSHPPLGGHAHERVNAAGHLATLDRDVAVRLAAELESSSKRLVEFGVDLSLWTR